MKTRELDQRHSFCLVSRTGRPFVIRGCLFIMAFIMTLYDEVVLDFLTFCDRGVSGVFGFSDTF